jgi:hypothetical protein
MKFPCLEFFYFVDRYNKGGRMKTEDNKMIFNKKDQSGEKYIAKTTFTLNFNDKDIKIIFSLN